MDRIALRLLKAPSPCSGVKGGELEEIQRTDYKDWPFSKSWKKKKVHSESDKSDEEGGKKKRGL